MSHYIVYDITVNTSWDQQLTWCPFHNRGWRQIVLTWTALGDSSEKDHLFCFSNNLQMKDHLFCFSHLQEKNNLFCFSHLQMKDHLFCFSHLQVKDHLICCFTQG